MTDRTETTPPLGALPPEDSGWAIGDRADKACVLAALDALQFEVGMTVTFELTQKAIDTYLAECARRGWKMS